MRGTARKIKRRSRQALILMLDQLRPFLGGHGRRLSERLVNPRGKLHIPPELGVTGFFAALERRGARHVVLRWFEELPHVERGHDLDILVADGAVEMVHTLLSTWPRGQKIDYYSESGAGGTGYRPELLEDVPAFPVAVAEQILASARNMPGGWQVPGPREHFLSLAYHAVYLKGYEAGLPPDADTPPRAAGSRDYAAVLPDLAEAAGIALEQPVTMASLDRLLRAEGWAPSDSHLAALAPANPWIEAAR